MGNKNIELRLKRREHVKERLKERFNIIEYKYFFNKVKRKKFSILRYLSNNRILCVLNLYYKDIYFILKKDKQYKEVLTVLPREMIISKYYNNLADY